MIRHPHYHFGRPPLVKGYDYYLWQAIERALKFNDTRFVWQDWKHHWRITDERPNCDHWEVNSFNNVVMVSEV